MESQNALTVGKQGCLILQKDYLKGLKDWTADEVTVYTAHHTGTPWRHMSEKEKNVSSAGLLLKISVISGCKLPETEHFSNAVESELITAIESDKKYSSLTYEEILTAFRMNAAGKLHSKISHYNNFFNLDYFYDVVNQFLEMRADVRIKEEQEKLKLLPPITPDLHIQWEEICESCYQEYLSGVSNYLTWPVEIYDVCANRYFEPEVYKDFIDQARVHLTHPEHMKIMQQPDMNKFFLTVITELRKEENMQVENVAKKMAVRFLFKKAKEIPYEHLFKKTEL